MRTRRASVVTVVESCPTYAATQSNSQSTQCVCSNGEKSRQCSVLIACSVSSMWSNLWVTPTHVNYPSLSSHSDVSVVGDDGEDCKKATKRGFELRNGGTCFFSGSKTAPILHASASER